MAGLDGVLRVPPEETLAEWWRLVRRLVVVALGTALRRGELLALRWQDVAMLEGRLTVRQSFVRGEFTTPKVSDLPAHDRARAADAGRARRALGGVSLSWRR
jgi:integrase